MLLERETQLRQLDHFRAEAAAGRGRLVVLSGEAGAGKTLLVREFLRKAQGARVLRSFCEDLSVADPLGPLYDLAREAKLPIAHDPERSQLSLFSDVLAMLEHGAGATIVIIEDIHWADDATLDFVRFVGRRLDGTHLLVLLTARTEGAAGQKRLRRALADIAPHNLARLDVPLLSLEAVGALASGAGLDGNAVYQMTGGNPFFVTELVAAKTSGLAPPENISAAVLDRADKLRLEARAALDLVSMFPRRAEMTLLLPMLGSGEGLDEVVAAGLLERTENTVAFRHEIARRAVEAAVPETARRRLNAGILTALQQARDVPVGRLVHHARAAGDPRTIVTLASAAGKWAATVGSHREAANYYMTAIDIAPDDAGLAHALAFEYSLTGRLEHAIAMETEALRLHRAMGDRVREGDSLRWLSRYSYLAGRRDDTDRYGDLAVELLETEAPGPELAMAYSNHAQLDMLAERVDATLMWGGKAIGLAQRLGRDDIVCATLNNMGNVRRWRDPEAARQGLGRSLEMALQHNWHEHAARAYTNWACMDIERRDFAAAENRLSAGITYCSERDLDTLRLYMTGWRAQLFLRRGQWSMAADTARQVLDSDLATPLARYQAADVVARLRLRRGDPGDDEPIAELENVLTHGREFQRLAPYATLMAERAWITGAGKTEALGLIDEAMQQIDASDALVDLAFWRSVLIAEATDWAALARYREAVGMPFEAAVALLMAGRGSEKTALLTLEKLGAGRVVMRARTVLAERGLRGPRRSSLGNQAGLTNRELDVLKRLGEGVSNKAIAAALNMSPKTVDHHVSAILQKLGVRSRGEAAAIERQRRPT